MIALPQNMNYLLDKIILDLPSESINLFNILDNEEFYDNLLYEEDGNIHFKDFVASGIAYLDINYTQLHKQLFAAIIMEIFGNVEDWDKMEPEEYEYKKDIFFEAIKDVEYQKLPQGHLDYDMVYAMLEEQLEL